MSSGVEVTTSLIPNLIMHVMACSGAAGREDYGERYGYTLNAEEVTFFKSLADDFTSKPPLAGGPLFTILFQIPSYFSANNVQDIDVTFEALKRSLERGSLDPLREAFPSRVASLDEWFPAFYEPSFLARIQPKVKGVIRSIDRFALILKACYERFYSKYWPTAREAMHTKAMRIREGLQPIDVLEAWKVILGRSFPYPDFKVCLCEPTNAVSSTMAEMIVIPSQDSVNASLQSIVHEAGVHFIGPSDWVENPKLSAIFRNDMEGLIRMVEAAICYLKPEVFRRMRVEVGEDPFLVGMRLEREAAVFGSIWTRSKTPEVIDAISGAYSMIRQI